MKKKQRLVAVLAGILICLAVMPVIQHENVSTVEAVSKLKLKNVGKKKTLYQYLKFTIKPNVKVSECKFSSNNKKVVTVNKKGVVTAKKKGTAKITIKYKGQKKKVDFTVKKSGKKYSPSRVAQIANQKLTKIKNSNGKKMVSLPDAMKVALKEGKINQEEYDKYYPTDGAGYIALYYELNLNETRSLDGTRLKTENAIANDIIDYYKVSDWDYFYIEYKGKKKLNKTMHYEIRLYNAKD